MPPARGRIGVSNAEIARNIGIFSVAEHGVNRSVR
jgi:hypothetical protein